MKPSRFFFIVFQVPVDYLMLLLAAFLTYLIRFQSLRAVRPVIYEIPLHQYFDVVSWVAAGWIVLFALNGMYRIARRGIMETLGKVFFGCTAGFVAVLLYLVFTQELFTSRFILLGTFILAFICVGIGRLIMKGFERLALKHGIGAAHFILIGAPETREIIRNDFEQRKSFGFRIINEYDHLNDSIAKQAQDLRKKRKLDGIMITDPNMDRDESANIKNLAEDLHVRFIYSADLLAAAAGNITIHTLAGCPMIELKKTRLEGWGKIYKRGFDILASILLLIITLPITIVVALTILIETGLPILFKNERIGQHGEKFDTLKFRSMFQKFSIGKQFGSQEKALEYEKKLIQEKSDKKEGIYKIKNDPRVTRVGKFIRRWSIDELPQLWNVLRGDMSLVGPRPHQAREVGGSSAHHRNVLSIKPGLTGLAQISGRSDLDFSEEIRLDTYYAENWSMTLDLFILLKTPIVVMMQKGSY